MAMEASGEPGPVALFKKTFERMGPGTALRLGELYEADVVFEDPFHRVEGLGELEAYFGRLNARIESAEFAFGTQVVGAGEAALTWTMTVKIRRPRQTIVVPGVSVLRFGERINFQRDYFDVGEMMYERLPVIGWLLRRVKRAVG
jgi:limonene-1,2-epoxide hydrolase